MKESLNKSPYGVSKKKETKYRKSFGKLNMFALSRTVNASLSRLNRNNSNQFVSNQNNTHNEDEVIYQ